MALSSNALTSWVHWYEDSRLRSLITDPSRKDGQKKKEKKKQKKRKRKENDNGLSILFCQCLPTAH